MELYDVIVIGSGHAGIEAACAAARMGSRVACITLSKNKIGHMPCNPAVGGIGKGHIVFEIAAFGGVMPQLCTKTYLQANMLNKSKGPAVQGLRLQIDKVAYAREAQKYMSEQQNITLIEGMATDIIVENGQIKGIRIKDAVVLGKTVVITTGTFLNGLLHVGFEKKIGGRENEAASTELTLSLQKNGIATARLKTGTPARLAKESINTAVMQEQISDSLDGLFEFCPHSVMHKSSCFITRTNKNTHDIIKANAHLSPIYQGDIKGIAPRYCPSIEDKIIRFAGKDSHQIFVEPESLELSEVYPNGLSTSLPLVIQEQFIRSIEGFEKAVIVRPGYAIEYDFVPPTQLDQTLQVKMIKGLFLAGQINGTTGYEEAAGQGLVAGINAAACVQQRAPFILHREESYIGLMINDLVTLGVDEPYRMFTSRAERRLLLRQDNTFYRLYKKAYEYNLITHNEYALIDQEYGLLQDVLQTIHSVHGLSVAVAQLFSSGKENDVYEVIKSHVVFVPHFSRCKHYLLAELLYRPYMQREEREAKKLQEYRMLSIPSDFLYARIPGLSIELQQKLTKYNPKNIADASLIQGMTPAALSLLIFKVQKK